MGANLNKLMQSYGVYTPTVSAYSGVATPDTLKAGATAGERGTYQGALADYAAQQAAYKGYETDYKNRIANTNLYTSPGPASTFLSTPNYSDITGMRANLSDTTSEDTTDYTNPDFSSMINDAYRSLGRVGIGTDTSNIDQPGYNYWLGQLQAGANGGIAPRDFKNQFKIATNDYIKQKPDDDYTKYIQGYLGILPAATLPVLPTTGGVTTSGTDVDQRAGEGPGANPGSAYDGGGIGSGATSGGLGYQAALDQEAGLAAAASFDGPQNALGGNIAASGPGDAAGQMAGFAAMARGGPVSSPTSMEEALLRDRSRHEFSDPRFEEIYGKYFYADGGGVVGGITNFTNLPTVEPTTTAATAVPAARLVAQDLPLGPSRATLDAAQAAKEAQSAFVKTLSDNLSNADSPPSMEEKWFGLASAFLSPTKTGKGGFMENVSLAAESLRAFAKSTTDSNKAAKAQKLQMMLKSNEITWQTAKEELRILQQADTEASRDQRAERLQASRDYRAELLEKNKNTRAERLERMRLEAESRKPLSDIGRRLSDEGLVRGTPEWEERYRELVEANDRAQAASLAAQDASLAAANKKLTDPLSDIGRRVSDMGFVAGTPEFNKKVEELMLLQGQTAREIQITDVMNNYNISRKDATDVVDKLVILKTDPVDGRQKLISVVTGNPVTPSADQRRAETSSTEAAKPAVPTNTLWQLASNNVTGLLAGAQAKAQPGTSQIGWDVARKRLLEDRQTFDLVSNELVRALALNPRFPVSEMDNIRREINISPNIYTSASALKERMRSVDNYLRNRLEDEKRTGQNKNLPPSVQKDALSAANSIENFLTKLGVPKDAPPPPRVGDQQTDANGKMRVFIGGDPASAGSWPLVAEGDGQ